MKRWVVGCHLFERKVFHVFNRSQSRQKIGTKALYNRHDANVLFGEASLHIVPSNFDQSIAVKGDSNTFLGAGMIAMTICRYQKYSYKRHSLLRNLRISGSYGCKMI